MSSNTKTFLFIVILVILVAGGLIFFASRNKTVTDNNNSTGDNGVVAGASTEQQPSYDSAYIEKLAKFLSEKGAVMYGAYWCPHCQDQKKLFGDAVKYIDYVECDAKGPNANPDECVAQGIDGYPTWIYQGKKFSGTQSLADLAKMVGFSEEPAAATTPQQ